MKTLFFLAAIGLLAGCSEFSTVSSQPDNRAVRGPQAVNDPQNEYNTSTTAGVPLLTADFPNGKDDSIHVHTVVDTARASANVIANPVPRPTEPTTDINLVPGQSTINLTPTGTRPGQP